MWLLWRWRRGRSRQSPLCCPACSWLRALLGTLPAGPARLLLDGHWLATLGCLAVAIDCTSRELPAPVRGQTRRLLVVARRFQLGHHPQPPLTTGLLCALPFSRPP